MRTKKIINAILHEWTKEKKLRFLNTLALELHKSYKLWKSCILVNAATWTPDEFIRDMKVHPPQMRYTDFQPVFPELYNEIKIRLDKIKFCAKKQQPKAISLARSGMVYEEGDLIHRLELLDRVRKFLQGERKRQS